MLREGYHHHFYKRWSLSDLNFWNCSMISNFTVRLSIKVAQPHFFSCQFRNPSRNSPFMALFRHVFFYRAVSFWAQKLLMNIILDNKNWTKKYLMYFKSTNIFWGQYRTVKNTKWGFVTLIYLKTIVSSYFTRWSGLWFY